MIVDMVDIFDAISEMKSSDLDELSKFINERRIACYRDTYDKTSTQVRDYLKKYGEQGFGIYVCDEYGNRYTLSPLQLKHGDYVLTLFHRDDEDYCQEYDISPEDRE